MRMRLVQVLHDRERLGQRRAIVVQHEPRHDVSPMERDLVLAMLLAFHKIDGGLLDVQSFQRQDDPNAVGRDGSPTALDPAWADE